MQLDIDICGREDSESRTVNLPFSETLRLPKIGCYMSWYFFGENFAVAYQRM